MPLLMWSNNYSVRIKSMDDQHRQLVDLINLLSDAIDQHNNDVAAAVLADLVDYTRTHFMDEERLMQTAGYPGLFKHKTEHRDLTNRAIDIQKHFSPTTPLGPDVLTFLKEWLINHIMGSDKAYAQFILAKGLAA